MAEKRLEREGAMGKGGRSVGERSDGFAVTAKEPFVGHDSFEPHGSARMDFSGRDSDFGPESEAVSVGESGRAVPEDVGGIDGGEECFGGGFVFGDDGIGVAGTVAVDMAHGLIGGIDDFDGENGIEVFRIPVAFGGGVAWDDGPGPVIAEESYGAGVHCGFERGEEGRCDFGMDEKRFDAIAGGGGLGFRIDGDTNSHFGIGIGVHIEVADTGGVSKDGDMRRGLDLSNEFVGSARDDQIDTAIEREHALNLVAAFEQRHPGTWDADRRRGIEEDIAQFPVGLQGFAAAFEEASVSAFQAKGCDLHEGIGAGFEDDADDTERA